MKIFETPELRISKFNRANMITLSGEETTGKTAKEVAEASLKALDSNITILNFVAG